MPEPGFFKRQNWIVDLTGYYQFGFNNFSFFWNYYYGEDYYNSRFNQTLSVLRFGFIADPRALLLSLN